MGGLIPEDVVEDIRSRVDIVEVISEYLTLKRSGRNFLALCPFHQEKTPSFNVNPEKQIFHCFGCGTGGDVFKFIMLIENVAFPEAVQRLGEKLGLTVLTQKVQPEHNDRAEQALKIYELVKDFYCWLLDQPVGQEAQEYLANRGLSGDSRVMFQVGYAPDRWDTLVNFLLNRGYRMAELLRLGLVQQGQGEGRIYDRFRHRVIFPLWNSAGRVVGFAGRTLDGSLPKYLNSPETEYFNKGRLLYGLHLARRSIREKGYAVIMEGYLDVITAHRYGITNAVASMGTSLTHEQGKLLMNYTHDIVIAYDADAAGVAAAVRGLDLLQEIGCRVRILSIPDGKDPDEYLKAHGPLDWQKLVDDATNLVEFKISQAVLRHGMADAGGKEKVLLEVLPNLLAMNSAVEQEEAIKLISTRLQLSWETVTTEFKRYRLNRKKKWLKTDRNRKDIHNIENDMPHGNSPKTVDARAKAEAGLLKLVLEEPALLAKVTAALGEKFFRNTGYQNIFAKLTSLFKDGQYQTARLFNMLDETEQNLLSRILVQEIPGGTPVQIISDYIKAISQATGRARKEELLRQLAEAEKNHDRQRVASILQEITNTPTVKN